MESTKKISLFIVVFLGLLTAITPLGTDLYLPALPIMPHELNTNASLIQMTIGIMTFGIAIGQLIGGPLSVTHLGEKDHSSLAIFYVSSLVYSVLLRPILRFY